MQSPLCKKLFYFTCKNEFILCRTLKLFLFAEELFPFSKRFANIYLFYVTWIPIVFPKIDIYYTFWPITHKLFTKEGGCLPTPFNFAWINCWLFRYVRTVPNPFEEFNWIPESLRLRYPASFTLILAWTPKLTVYFFKNNNLLLNVSNISPLFSEETRPLKYNL